MKDSIDNAAVTKPLAQLRLARRRPLAALLGATPELEEPHQGRGRAPRGDHGICGFGSSQITVNPPGAGGAVRINEEPLRKDRYIATPIAE